MLFSIRSSAMSGGDAICNKLDQILSRSEDGVHEIEILDAESLEESDWYRTCRADRRKLLEAMAQSALYRSEKKRGPHLRRFDVVDDATATCAKQLAHTPLEVLVENAFSDGALVTAAINVFGEPETIELCVGSPSTLDPPAFLITSGGGHGELSKLIRKRLEEAAARGRPPRMLVVTDSDGEWNGDVKVHAQDIRDECLQNGIPCPPLDHRTAENYIPDEILKAWAEAKGDNRAHLAVSALIELGRDQRDYVRIGKGNEAPWNANEPAVAALFEGVALESYELLTKASLKGRNDGMVIFSLLDHKEKLTREVFLRRDHRNDLPTLVQQIEDEL